MPPSLIVAHIAFPAFVITSYVYFVYQLNRYFEIFVAMMSVLAFLTLCYTLFCIKLLYSRPGHISKNQKLNDNQTEDLEQCKKNQRARINLMQKMKKNLTYQSLYELQKQTTRYAREYLNLYCRPSYCQLCQKIKPPRAYHCPDCNRCILRRQKHSQLIGKCIGQKNNKVFMQYLIMAMILCVYMIVTVLLVTTIQHHDKLNDFNSVQLILFAFIEMSLGTCLILFIKQISISYYNITQSITETQRKEGIINERNNPFKNEDFQHKLFKTAIDYFKMDEIIINAQQVDLED